ncbi:MAG TPA: O-antigen ligase family protein [Gaiellaceae bacterium]|nr:O-antigen ligase family protein [Gaiellaceae bacterium]
MTGVGSTEPARSAGVGFAGAGAGLRRPVWALHVLIVGLAFHNLVMSQLWRAGVRGNALTVVAAWKDVLLLVALALVVRSVPRPTIAADWLALAFGAFVVLYGLLPQSLLDGGATHRGVLYAARHDLLPVGAYFLGRGLALTGAERARLCRTVLVTAAVVALYGLIDVSAVPLSWWRHSGAPGWFQDQLGLRYNGLSGLPENFAYNAGNGVVFRRLTSTFLSPLATAYLLVVAMFFVPFRLWWGRAVALLLFAALLWTHTRAGVIALVVALLVLALVRRRALMILLAVAVAVIGFAFVKTYTHFGPRTHYTATELHYQQTHPATPGSSSNDATTSGDSSISEHASSLREGARTVLHHPWGFGLGNAGVTAARTHVRIRAGESTYTELGVEVGVLGVLAFVLWSLVLLRGALARVPWIGAAFAAVLFLGLQTDIIGVPWIAVTVFALVGDAVRTPLHQHRNV